jgi:uncharacterized membrane protein
MNFLANLILAISLLAPLTPTPPGVVRAVLFYSPSCGHCEYVITEVLPPLFETYGEKLEMVGIDVTQPAGQALYMDALKHFELTSGGVPFLVIGEHGLMGSADIPEQLPGLIDSYLAQGGVDWAEIPGLQEALAASPETAPQENSSALPETSAPASLAETFGRDPLGNGLAVFTLALMLAVGLGALWRYPAIQPGDSHPWLLPALSVVGLGVAGYLAYVETQQVAAVCGPVGDCNAVQQSEYAYLFGVLPIGILGLGGYLLILAAWVISRFGKAPAARLADLALGGMTFAGLAFSIYLTFLEPFVIGATCAWCLASAWIMTILFALSLPPLKRAFLPLPRR